MNMSCLFISSLVVLIFSIIGLLTVLSSNYTLHKNWQLGDGLEPLHILQVNGKLSFFNNTIFVCFYLFELTFFFVTCQLRVRSICPATYEASPESSA